MSMNWAGEGKRALVATVVATVFNPFSVVMGYALARTLSRPDVQISSVQIAKELEPIHLKTADGEQLKKVLTKAWFREHDLASCQRALVKNAFLEDCLADVFESGDEVRATYEAQLKEIDSEIAAFSAVPPNMQVVSKSNAGIPMDGSTLGLQQLTPHDSRQMVTFLQGVKIRKQAERDAFESLQKLIGAARALVGDERPLSGDVVLTVVLTNSGDSNAIVPKSGALIVSGQRIVVTARKRVTVKARDTEEVELTVNKMDTPASALRVLSEAVRKSNQMDFELSLLDAGVPYKGRLDS